MLNSSSAYPPEERTGEDYRALCTSSQRAEGIPLGGIAF
jgi:hypothetical protein